MTKHKPKTTFYYSVIIIKVTKECHTFVCYKFQSNLANLISNLWYGQLPGCDLFFLHVLQFTVRCILFCLFYFVVSNPPPPTQRKIINCSEYQLSCDQTLLITLKFIGNSTFLLKYSKSILTDVWFLYWKGHTTCYPHRDVPLSLVYEFPRSYTVCNNDSTSEKFEVRFKSEGFRILLPDAETLALWLLRVCFKSCSKEFIYLRIAVKSTTPLLRNKRKKYGGECIQLLFDKGIF